MFESGGAAGRDAAVTAEQRINETETCHPWRNVESADDRCVRFRDHGCAWWGTVNTNDGANASADADAGADGGSHRSSDPDPGRCARNAPTCDGHGVDPAQRGQSRTDPRRSQRQDSVPVHERQRHDVHLQWVVCAELATIDHFGNTARNGWRLAEPPRDDYAPERHQAGHLPWTPAVLLHRRLGPRYGQW